MGTSLIVRVRPEGVELTQAAIERIGKAVADAARSSSQAASTAVVQHADVLGDRYAKAGLRVTEAMSRVADSGNLAGGSMNRVVAIASEMAFAFGATGPIVGALAVAGIAVARFFASTREEIEKTRVKIQELQYTGQHGAGVTELRELYQGRPGMPSLGDLAGRAVAGAGAVGPLAPLISWWMGRGLDTRRSQIDAATGQILNPLRTPPTMGLPPVTITGRTGSPFDFSGSPGWNLYKNEDEARQKLAKIMAEQMAGPQVPAWQKGVLAGAGGGMDRLVKATTDDMVNQIAEGINASFQGEGGKRFGQNLERMMAETAKKMKWVTLRNELGAGIASAVGGGIAVGIQAALATGNLTTAFQQLGRFISTQLGQILADVALKAIGFAKLMAQFETWLVANPWAAIGIGLAMVALAKSFQSSGMGGGVTGGFGGGYGGSYGAAVGAAETTRVLWGADSTTVAAGLTPRSATSVVIIGPDDPKAQRGILELIRKAERRG